jgi:hypothetical protein
MSDDNVRLLPAPLPPFLRDTVKAVDALIDALKTHSRTVAEMLHHSNTLGFNYLLQILKCGLPERKIAHTRCSPSSKLPR